MAINIGLQQDRLSEISKKILKKLKSPKLPIDFDISNWMADRSYPWFQMSYIEQKVWIDVRDTVDKTDDEVYSFVCNELIKNLTLVLNRCKEL